jgi:hypothetical protein
MNNELDSKWKKAVVVSVQVLSKHLPRGIEENSKTKVTVAIIPTKIQTGYLPTTCLEGLKKTTKT